MVTGDYSRGAAGFWIENGERTYPVSEVTIAGHLLDIFRTLTPANDLEFRYGTNAPTRAPGGTDRCRRLSSAPRASRDRERLAAAVREAGALALQVLRRAAQELDQGRRRLAGHRSRHRGQRAAARAPAARAGDGWLSEESENDPARLAARSASGWSIRSTARAPSSPAARTGRCRRRWSRTGRPVAGGAVCAGRPTSCSWRRAGGGATRNGAPIAASGGRASTARASAGPSACSTAWLRRHRASCAMPRIHSLALRLARVAHGELDAAIAGGNGHDWDLAAADLLVHEAGGVMTALDGRPLIYNRPDPVHGVAGRRRARAPCGAGRTGARADQRAGVIACASRAQREGTGDVRPPRRSNCCIWCSAASSSRLDTTEFKDLDKLDIVGIYPNYATAYAAWKAKAQQTVDNAQMRYFIVHLHRLLDPESDRRAVRRAERGVCRMLSSRKLTSSPWVQRAIGVAAARIPAPGLADHRFAIEPPDIYERIRARRCRSSWRCGTASIS